MICKAVNYCDARDNRSAVYMIVFDVTKAFMFGYCHTPESHSNSISSIKAKLVKPHNN